MSGNLVVTEWLISGHGVAGYWLRGGRLVAKEWQISGQDVAD